MPQAFENLGRVVIGLPQTKFPNGQCPASVPGINGPGGNDFLLAVQGYCLDLNLGCCDDEGAQVIEPGDSVSLQAGAFQVEDAWQFTPTDLAAFYFDPGFTLEARSVTVGDLQTDPGLYVPLYVRIP